MATKSDFIASEWEVLRDTPHAVVLAIASAGGSGLFGSIKEAMAPAGIFVDALKGENQLLRQICDNEEIKASIESLKNMAKEIGDFKTIQSTFRMAAIDKSRISMDLLKQKGTPEDVAAYKEFILRLGEKVANAAKEGAFLGFGGERVSENERAILNELAQVLEVFQA